VRERGIIMIVFRTFRKARGLSQEGLPEATSLQKSWIGEGGRGKRNIRIENLAGIAKGLGVSFSELLQEVD